MTHKLHIWGVLILLFASTAKSQSCSDFDVDFGPFNFTNSGNAQHTSGIHAWQASFVGECSYSDGLGDPCYVQANTGDSASAGDSGKLKLVDCCYHVPAVSVTNGVASSNGGSVQAGAEAAVSVMDCLSGGCGIAPSISVSVNGLGASVTFPNGSVFNDKNTYTVSCAAETQPGGGDGGGGGGGGGGCSCGGGCNGGGSPIVVDTIGGGFHFSNPAVQCTLFDLHDNNKPVCLSWPVEGSGNAWLALPDENGNVENSKQLFGNFTPQPGHKSKMPNGFLALAEYDANSDLVIDKKDPVFAKLRLWIDEHCYLSPNEVCVSRPSELHKLSEYGIENIGLIYGAKQKRDRYGNRFRFYSHLNIDMGREDRQHTKDDLNRTLFDVWLVKGNGPKGQECE